jgi:dipeptidyl aminopeptidase/acylaminoacyl peptidase
VTRIVAPYGTWRSSISAARVAAASVTLGGLAVDGDAIYWLEGRPGEGGRTVLVRWRAATGAVDLTPPPWNVRSRVHEYGGGAFAVAGGIVVCSHLPDQRLYRVDDGGAPRPLTPESPWRFADGVVDPHRRRLFCVGEDHGGGGHEPENCLVRVDVDRESPPLVVARGHDFYAAPRLSPDGGRLAWIAWRHPDMPWDGTELWVARVGERGDLRDARLVAGGRGESILEPSWAPDGRLLVTSDRSGWWNLHHVDDAGLRPLCPLDGECARPPWILGMSHACTLPDGTIVCAVARGGRWRLGRIAAPGAPFEPLETPYTEIGFVRAAADGAVFVGASPTAGPAVVHVDVRRGACTVLRPSGADGLEPSLVSIPEAFSCAGAQGRVVHGLRYAPHNPDHAAPAGSRPPGLVRCHGGPTSSATAALDPSLQFWTARGFAVLDVNYAGSSGYGRAYRRLLDGAWGVADVEDCVAAARAAVARGWVDPGRLVIRGSSAGGFTVLCALAFHGDAFAAGASYYGIGDLEALHRETHKFESHYDERLIGPFPERRDLYRSRSPLYAADRIRRPVIFFQGLTDRVVPPEQAVAMAGALRARGIEVAHVTFPDEGHGFRQASTIVAALEQEFAFYHRVLGMGRENP